MNPCSKLPLGVCSLLVLVACAPAKPARTQASPTEVSSAVMPEPIMTNPETMAQDADAACDLVVGDAVIVPRPADQPDLHAHAVDNANRVLTSMNDDLLACYKKRTTVRPNAHAFLTVDILVGTDGKVMRVDTTGGALLGAATMGCIVHRIEKAQFDPPYGGGTRHITVPFNFRKVAPEEEP